LFEILFFTARVSVYFNRTNILYEVSAVVSAATPNARENSAAIGDLRVASTATVTVNDTWRI
jgi:hypothetical protein